MVLTKKEWVMTKPVTPTKLSKSLEYKFNQDLFIQTENHYRLMDGAGKKYWKNTCGGCGKNFFSTHAESLCCSDKCRAARNDRLRGDSIASGHYTRGSSTSRVEMFTKSGSMFTIDNEDLDSINRYKWTKDKYGYVTTCFRHYERLIHIKLHRLILSAKEGETVDHIDGDVSNNQKSNLRVTNKSVNALNSNKSNAASGHRNIYVRNSLFVFRMSVTTNGKRNVTTKSFSSLIEAIKFRDDFKASVIDELVTQSK